MALEQLVATLENEARAEADRLLATARATAAELLAQGQTDIARRREQDRTAREAAARAPVELGVSAARFQARRIMLDARHGFADTVFRAARGHWPDILRRPAYRAGLRTELEEALASAGGRAAVVQSCPDLYEDLARLAAGKPAVTVARDPAVEAGFRMVVDGGALEMNCTLDARLSAQRPALLVELFRRAAT
jgi:vacuolar-type H+-ATPase subunit E/Vma4